MDAIAADAATVFWADASGLWRRGHGAERADLLLARDRIAYLTVDATHVYWLALDALGRTPKDAAPVVR